MEYLICTFRKFFQKESNGEEVAQFIVSKRKKRSHEEGKFMIVYQDALREFVVKNEKRNKMIIFFYLASYADFENKVSLSREKIANETKINKYEVSRHITEMIKEGYIRKIKHGEYMINPYFLRKGKNTRLLEKWNSIK